MAEEEAPAPDVVPGAPHPVAASALYGQEAAERAFLDAWRTGRLHHAWILAGPEGVGKATLAYRIARALIAARDTEAGRPGGVPAVPETLDPPETCPVLARMRAGAEPQLRALKRSPSPKTGKLRVEIVVEDVRKLKDFFQLSIPDGGRRVVIVDPADALNTQAANAFLKSLEEPPAGTVMLLVSHRPGRLLPTIRSRCRRLALEPLGARALAMALAGAGQEPPPPEDAEALAELAGGSVGRAIALGAGGGRALYAEMIAMMAGAGVDRARLIALAEGAGGRDSDGARLAGELTATLAARLALYGAGRPPAAEAAPGEARLAARAAPDLAAARAWAEAGARASATLVHARAVNLDPIQSIIDIWLDLDRTLAGRREPV